MKKRYSPKNFFCFKNYIFKKVALKKKLSLEIFDTNQMRRFEAVSVVSEVKSFSMNILLSFYHKMKAKFSGILFSNFFTVFLVNDYFHFN